MQSISVLSPGNFPDYELIDSGAGEKLERFGTVTLIRPEPQALWQRNLSLKIWEEKHDIRFKSESSSKGVWIKKKASTPDRWEINYSYQNLTIRLRLALTSFKHVGVFPEQAVNWDYIAENIKGFRMETPRFLNLFAYTGAASCMAAAAGAQVTHVDSIKQVVNWGKENSKLSKLDNIRWMIDDALKFVKKEVKRGNQYQGILLDPPAYGHGPNGEKWKLTEQLGEMIETVVQLLDPAAHFLVLNTYSLGFSSVIVGNILEPHLPKDTKIEIAELLMPASFGKSLPLGVVTRFSTLNPMLS